MSYEENNEVFGEKTYTNNEIEVDRLKNVYGSKKDDKNNVDLT